MRVFAVGLLFLAAAPLPGQSRPSPGVPSPESRAVTRATVSSLAAALRDPDPVVRRESARALRASGRDAAPAVPALAEALAACDGKTAVGVVVSYLDALRAIGAAARPAAEALARLLPPEAALYAERDKSEVTRLRSYLFATLADVGVPSSAVPHVVDSLVNTDERTSALEATAAARAAGALETGGGSVAGYLVRAVETGYLDDSVSLERYETPFPVEEATTFSREALRALERLRPRGNREVLQLLEQIAAGEHPLVRRDPTLAARARRALDAITDAPVPPGK
jgi:hypothetical protein